MKHFSWSLIYLFLDGNETFALKFDFLEGCKWEETRAEVLEMIPRQWFHHVSNDIDRLLKEAENKTILFFFKDFWRIDLMQQKKRENNCVIKETMSNYEVVSWHDWHYHSNQQAMFWLFEHCFLFLFSFGFCLFCFFWWTHMQDLIIRQDFI